MPEIDPVILKLKVEHDQYLRDLRNATRMSEHDLKRIDRAGFATGVALKKGFSVAKAAALSFAGALSVNLVVGAIKSGLDYASALGEQAAALGITTDALQEYSYAASQAGLSQSDLETAIQQLTRRTGDAAQGVKESVDAFERLGISIRDSKGEIKNAGDLIPEIAEGLKSIPSEAERAAITVDLFGRSGQKMAALLADGAAGVNNLRDAAHRLGIVLSSDQIASADEAADKLEAVKRVLQAKLAGVVADNADEILRLANALANLADKAIKAADAWLGTKRALGERDQMVARANAYLDGRKDLAPGERKATKALAARMIDKRLGIEETGSYLGGLVKTKRVNPIGNAKSRLTGADRPDLAGNLERSLSGAPGQGADIAALLGVDPVAVVTVATSLANGLASLEADIAAARAELSGDLREQAQARKQQIDAELGETLARVDEEEGISAETKKTRKALETQRAILEKQIVDKQLQRDLDRDLADEAERQLNLREDQTRREIDALAAEADLADTRGARLDVERRILALRQEEERKQLEAAIADGQVLDAKKARAAVEQRQSAERGSLERAFEGPLARFARDARNSGERVAEAAARRIQDLNDTISNVMVKRLGVKDPFLRDLLSIFLDRNLFGPIAEALSRASSGGGGLLGAIVGAIGAIGGAVGGGSTNGGLSGTILPSTFRGRASGGHVNAGTMYRVNEGGSPGRVEAFVPQGAGDIIPLGRMNAMRGGGAPQGTVKIIIEEAEGFASRVRTEAAGVAIEVQRAAAPGVVRAAVSETFRQAGRPKI